MSVIQVKTDLSVQEESFQSRLKTFARDLDQRQLSWASGYLAGLSERIGSDQQLSVFQEASSPALVWQLFFATETGNSRTLAQELAHEMAQRGVATELIDLCDYRPRQLKKETHALFILATHGLGEAPEGTDEFFEYLLQGNPGNLQQLHYSVLALGDSSYADFCAVGRRVDARLSALGAHRIAPRIDCDIDFEADASDWQQQILEAAAEQAQALFQAEPQARPQSIAQPPNLVPFAPSAWTRSRPFAARVLKTQRITGTDSTKEVHHLVLDLEGSDLNYQPGDALGVWPVNPRAITEPLVTLLQLDAAQVVELDGDRMTLQEALDCRLEVTQLGAGLLRRYAEKFAIEPLQALLNGTEPERLSAYISERQVIDLLHEYPQTLTAQELVGLLRKLSPRLYSIACSARANPDEVHLTVSVVDYSAWNRPHFGAASGYLSQLPGATEQVRVYVVPNPRFRLPSDPNSPIIMIAAGAGIAPFRAFLQEREINGDHGDNWLIFGDRNFRADFLYQTEWARYRKDGLLTRHDIAFSRDQQEKVYVQDRIRQQGAEIVRWIDRGANLYVCGDAQGMAVEVEQALTDVLAESVAGDLALAAARLQQLRQAHRYQRDVY